MSSWKVTYLQLRFLFFGKQVAELQGKLQAFLTVDPREGLLHGLEDTLDAVGFHGGLDGARAVVLEDRK